MCVKYADYACCKNPDMKIYGIKRGNLSREMRFTPKSLHTALITDDVV